MEFRFPHNKTKALTFSYDDGQLFDRRLVQLFQAYGIKATFHLNSGTLDHPAFVTSQEVSQLYEGMEVSAHTVNHPHPHREPRSMAVGQLWNDRLALERLTGYPIRGMSYPFGENASWLAETAGICGMEYSRTVHSTFNFDWPQDFLQWNPTCHHSELTDELICRFLHTPSYESAPLLYVWGHSYEFDRDHNWDWFEQQLAKLAHQEQIWYATNIQLKDYISAVSQLIVSAEGTMLLNPTAQTIWLTHQGVDHTISPGELLRLP